MIKFAIILSGCGVYDGAEIHESVLTLLAIDRAGGQYQCFAPDIRQHHVINHATGKEMAGERNVLAEAARISRGNIKPLDMFRAADYDALVFPGGFGAAKNLCDWAIKGDGCTVDPSVERAVNTMHEAGKPIGAMCIAPVILAKILKGASLTTGRDPASAGFIDKTGNKALNSNHGEVIADRVNKIYTTPCYMLDATISQIAQGTGNLIMEMMKDLGQEVN